MPSTMSWNQDIFENKHFLFLYLFLLYHYCIDTPVMTSYHYTPFKKIEYALLMEKQNNHKLITKSRGHDFCFPQQFIFYILKCIFGMVIPGFTEFPCQKYTLETINVYE